MPEKKVIITGASGFVGKKLCGFLTRAGFPIRAVVRDKIASPAHDIEIYDGVDLAKRQCPRGALAGGDCLVHLAGRVQVMDDPAEDPLQEFRKVNVEATLNLARQAACAGLRRFVFLSSVKVHGETTPDGMAFTEADHPAPGDPYAVSKLEAEQGLLEISRQSNMEVVIIRPPLVYGPGVKGNFRSLMTWINKGTPLPLGGIKNKRSFVGVNNLIDFILTCMNHPAAANQIFLISDGEDISTTELIKMMAQAMNKPARLIPVPAFFLEPIAAIIGKRKMAQRLFGSLQADISKARKVLGWNAPFNVREGLFHCIKNDGL